MATADELLMTAVRAKFALSIRQSAHPGYIDPVRKETRAQFRAILEDHAVPDRYWVLTKGEFQQVIATLILSDDWEAQRTAAYLIDVLIECNDIGRDEWVGIAHSGFTDMMWGHMDDRDAEMSIRLTEAAMPDVAK